MNTFKKTNNFEGIEKYVDMRVKSIIENFIHDLLQNFIQNMGKRGMQKEISIIKLIYFTLRKMKWKKALYSAEKSNGIFLYI